MEIRKREKIKSPLQRIFGEDFNLPLFLRIFRKSIIWIFILIALALVVAFLYLRYTYPTYRSNATLIFKEPEQMEVMDVNPYLSRQHGDRLISDIELIKSNELVSRAIERLPLEISYFEKGNILSTEFYKNSPFTVDVNIRDSSIMNIPIFIRFTSANTYAIEYVVRNQHEYSGLSFGDVVRTPHFDIITSNKVLQTSLPEEFNERSFYFVINSKPVLINQILSSLSVGIQNSQAKTIGVNYIDHKPEKAIDIVNTLAEEFVLFDVERQMQSAENILSFINIQIDTIQKELLFYEDLINDFKRANRVVDPATERGIILDKLEQLDKRSRGIAQELQSLEWLEEYVRSGKPLATISPDLLEGKFMGLSMFIARMAELEQRKERLSLSAKEPHLEMQYINRQLAEAQQNLIDNIKSARERIQLQLNILNRESGSLEGAFSGLPAKEAELERLRKLYTLKETDYLGLLEKQRENEIIRAGIVENYTILDRAKGTELVAPKKRMIQIGAIGVGLFLGLLLVVVRYLLQNKIQALSDVEDNTDVPVLGIIPSYRNNHGFSEIIVNKNPKSMISEAFRSVRSNLEFISGDDSSKVMAVTSTVAGEGKTFIALNLAAVVNMTGKKVVVVDLDLRKPKIHNAFNVENSYGMSTLLIGRNSIDECIFKSTIEGLDFIPSGPIPPNPAELILSQKLVELLQYLKLHYDLIVIDTPPIGLVADAMELMKIVDYPIYVLRAEFSNREFINHPNRLYLDKKVNNLSIILNDVNISRSNYGRYSYSYGYGYGYGYNYGAGSGYYSEDNNEAPSLWQRFKRRIGLNA